MNPELMELLLRMGMQDPFANQQILGRDPRQFQQATELLGSQIQQQGQQPVQNPTFDLMSQLVLEAMAQGMMNQPAPARPGSGLIDFFKNLVGAAPRPASPDRSQTGSLEQIIFDMLNRTQHNPDAAGVEEAISKQRQSSPR